MKRRNITKNKEGAWRRTGNPNLCWTVARRRFADDVLYTLDALLKVLETRGRSLTWSQTLPERRSYWSAVERLRKKGLIAYRKPGGRDPVLILTEDGAGQLPDATHPERFWDVKWDGTWYVLVFDVPERQRGYRHALRGFLKRMHMGCLQRSVWVSPRDIRPAYDDLDEAAAARDYCFLFQSRTVLRQSPQEVVTRAWPMDEVRKDQNEYLQIYSANLRRLSQKTHSENDLHALLREERMAYLAAMEKDPLLPQDLWPKGYLGRQVHSLHRLVMDEIARQV